MTRRLRILTYHRIAGTADPTGNAPSLVSSTAQVFDRQMAHLAQHYNAVTPAEIIAAEAAQRELPPKAVLVTFDDAYRDFADVAWPIMKKHGIPATLFVPTAYPGQPERRFWWDRLDSAFAASPRTQLPDTPLGTLSLATPQLRRMSVRRLKDYLLLLPHAQTLAWVERVCDALGVDPASHAQVLAWDELRALARDGVSLGAHTRTHPALTRLPLEQARTEIQGAIVDLRREIGPTPAVFSYPFGIHDDHTVELVRAAGFRLAVTCLRGQSKLPLSEPLRLQRINMTQRTSGLLFRARLLYTVTRVDAWQDRFRMGRRTARLQQLRQQQVAAPPLRVEQPISR